VTHNSDYMTKLYLLAKCLPVRTHASASNYAEALTTQACAHNSTLQMPSQTCCNTQWGANFVTEQEAVQCHEQATLAQQKQTAMHWYALYTWSLPSLHSTSLCLSQANAPFALCRADRSVQWCNMISLPYSRQVL
jgi:hypothetical protein